MTPFLEDPDVTIISGDARIELALLEAGSVDAIVTSPPYLDSRPEYPSPSPAAFLETFRELRRVCSGGMIVNAGRKFRDGREIPFAWEIASLAESAGWTRVDSIIWAKPNANPIQGPVVTNAHEYLLLFGRPEDFDPDAVRLEYQRGTAERMRRRFVSSVSVKGDTAARNGQRRDEKRGMNLELNPAGARPQSVVVFPAGREKGNKHPAPMPLAVAEYCVALVRGDRILDPYAGSGTTAVAARARGKRSLLIELDLAYCEMASRRLLQQGLLPERIP